MVRDMDKKQREEFDSTLASGVSSSSWAQIEARAWQRLESGEYDRGTSLADSSLTGSDPAVRVPTQGGGE